MIEELTIKQILIDEGYIRPEDAQEADVCAIENNRTFTESLLIKKILTKDILGQALAEHFGVQYINLESHEIDRETITRIPEEIAHKYHVFLYAEDKKNITILTDNPQNKDINKALKKLFPKKKITKAFVLSKDVTMLLKNYKKSLTERIWTIIDTGESIAPHIIDEIFQDALEENASDIHFEPDEDDVSIRFRIDGVLESVGKFPASIYDKILNRIKVQAHMRMDQHMSTQDGSIRTVIDGNPLDIRVSIVPTILGEKITLRVLTSYLQGLSLSDIGLSPTHQKQLTKTAKKPFGMILITGPTGSGKTTSLYSVLQLLNSPDKNITTIEDPVEYKVKGINQIKVNPETDLTFANGLRSIVRQDPDVILVGEIRDEETAEIAVNASLTGHLLLSTFHANDTATSIVRMLDMGIEPFLLSSTLELIVAQRLVRKICPYTKHSVTYSIEELEQKLPNAQQYFGDGPITLYEGKPSPYNNNTGYIGRTALFEFLPMSKDLQELILKNPSKKEILDLAKTQGAQTLFEDGIEKVKQGITTLDELLRVASPDV